MKLLITTLITALTLSCACAEEWKPEGYAHVVGYTYDCTRDPLGYSIILEDGSLHDGVIRAATIRLTQEQVDTLLKLTKERPDDGKTVFEELECHDPHHAFVFYTKDWKPVAWINICFLCANTSTNTRGSNPLIDLAPLERFCEQLGMPILQAKTDYTQMYKAENAVKE